jgi:outer membrane protein OmpA-like peptidoglycan-associated protein
MRTGSAIFAVFLGLTSAARGQVSVDMRALDQLGPAPPAPRAAPVPARRPVPVSAPAAATPAPKPVSAVPATQSARNSTAPAATAPAAPAPVTAAHVPPLPSEIPSTPPASATVAAPAPSPEPLPPPVRLVFQGGGTELTPEDEAAIRDLAHAIPDPDVSSINVVAYASGKPDDASTARRLSLSRGMAVRSVLLASGVPSAQIYVRALGATAADGPADQVDLIVTRIGTVTR